MAFNALSLYLILYISYTVQIYSQANTLQSNPMLFLKKTLKISSFFYNQNLRLISQMSSKPNKQDPKNNQINISKHYIPGKAVNLTNQKQKLPNQKAENLQKQSQFSAFNWSIQKSLGILTFMACPLIPFEMFSPVNTFIILANSAVLLSDVGHEFKQYLLQNTKIESLSKFRSPIEYFKIFVMSFILCLFQAGFLAFGYVTPAYITTLIWMLCHVMITKMNGYVFPILTLAIAFALFIFGNHIDRLFSEEYDSLQRMKSWEQNKQIPA